MVSLISTCIPHPKTAGPGLAAALTACCAAAQFSADDYARFTDICKLFEANSRLDFITVSR